MDTPTAVIISQIPLGIACIMAAHELYKIRKTLEKMVKTLSKRG